MPKRALSRREVLRWAGAGAAGAALASLTAGGARAARTPLERLLPGVRVLGRLPGLQSVASALPDLQLPFWGDGAGWDQPQYYETIQAGKRRTPKTLQSADINDDGQDELIARGGAGILAHQFDPDAGQWVPLPNGPPWGDASGWDLPQYYQTIQTADIDGDGRAELLARGAGGVTVWKFTAENSWMQLPDGPAWADDGSWDLPQYYTTIQCADVDGDGQDELLGRGAEGMQTWKYDSALQGWRQLSAGSPAWADGGPGWDHPQYYETIQCADLFLPGDPGYTGDGTHKQAVLLARGADGMQAWKYVATGAFQGGWELLAAQNPEWSDNWSWDLPQYYTTIQCADIDGDGRDELLGRGSTGIAVAKFYPASGTWNSLPGLPGFADAPQGWVSPQYYQTIQTADIDGDGQAEVLARDAYGIIAFQYDSTGQSWNELPRGPKWDDAGGWDQVHYYATIQTARVTGSATNPNNPLVPAGKPVAALLGRDALSLKTWRFDGAAQSWSPTSVPFPQFTGAQLNVYQYLNQNLFSIDPNQDLRAQYATLTADGAGDWQKNLSDGNPITLLPPQGMSATDPDWLAVRKQIYDELTLLINLLGIAQDTNLSLLFDITEQNGLLQQIDDELKASQSNNAVAVTVIQILAGAAVAVSALAAPPVALVAGLLAAGSIGLGLIPDSGGPLELEFEQLKAQLLSTFDAARQGNNQGTQATTQDYGLLSILGKDIHYDLDAAVEAVTASYRAFAYEHLTPMVWRKAIYDPLPAGAHPDYSLYTDKGDWGYSTVFELRQAYQAYPPEATLQHVFDPPPGGVGFSVQEAMADWQFKCVTYIVPDECPPGLPDLPATARVDATTVALTRDRGTGGVWVRVRLRNTGNAQLTNVEITWARLRGRAPVTALPTPRIRLAHPRTHEALLYFPESVGSPGERTVLQIRGAYRGGTFGASLRVTLP